MAMVVWAIGTPRVPKDVRSSGTQFLIECVDVCMNSGSFQLTITPEFQPGSLGEKKLEWFLYMS